MQRNRQREKIMKRESRGIHNFFAGSEIEIPIAFRIRDQNFDQNKGIIHEKNIPHDESYLNQTREQQPSCIAGAQLVPIVLDKLPGEFTPC